MEIDMTYSPYSDMSKKGQPRKESSSDSSREEWSYTSPRNQRKRFWKGGEYETVNDTTLHKNFSKRKTTQSCNDEGTKSYYSFVKGKVYSSHLSPTEYHNKRTTIKLTNVPVKMNNILDLYHSFSRFGTITLIQAQRNSNPFCAILSFSTTEEAIKAMENIKKVLINGKAVWFLDICLLNSSTNGCNMNNEMVNFSDKLNYTPVFENSEYDVESQHDVNYEKNLENAITELIRKKSKLLSHQMDSLKEILEKMDKCKTGSKEQQILLDLLNKIRRQIHENKKSIEYSMQQKNAYFAKKKKILRHKSVKKLKSNCPPWITAYKSSIAKRSDSLNNQQSCQRNDQQVLPIKLHPYQECSGAEGDLTSSSASGNEFADSSEESASEKGSSSHAYKNMQTLKSRRKKALRARIDLIEDERYVYELDCLLSDTTNEWQETE